MPGGRPTKLNQVVRVRNDGTKLTCADVVLEATRYGMEVDDAAAAANLSKVTIYAWKKAGAQAHAKAARGERLTKSERDYAEFLNDLETARSEFELGRLDNIHRAGRGGAKVVETHTTTRRTAKGDTLTETRTVEKTLLPQWQADAWLLERRMPAKYRRRVELTGQDGRDLVPVEKRAHDLAESFDAFLQGADAQRQRQLERSDGTFDGS